VGQLASTFNDMLARLQSAYEKLEASYTAQRRFVADASHELRTPLTTIRGNVELLQKMGDEDPEVRAEALQDIKSEAERMCRLINDLLALARADAGQQPEKHPVALAPLLQEIFRQAQLLKGQVNFEHDDPEMLGEAKLLANADYLKQLFLILLDNAFKFTPPGGTVKFSFHQAGNSLSFAIEDTGQGISPEDLPHIFERFYQANKTRGGQGTGLGLAIAKWIMEIHGGEIKVKSEPGRGSTFTVTFFNIF
jgi:signal transduction histidine kinase